MPDPDALQDADDEERYGTVNFLATGPTNDRWAAHTLWHSAYLASTLLLNLCLQHSPFMLAGTGQPGQEQISLLTRWQVPWPRQGPWQWLRCATTR